MKYKNHDITKITESFFTEERELEGGHSSRGTGRYERIERTLYKVKKKKFTSLKEAKRFVDRTLNRNKQKKIQKQLKRAANQMKSIEKKCSSLKKDLYKLGF